MTPSEIDEWLNSIDRDRQWLANKLGISMGTLYNGFSKGFTKRSITRIKDLMNEVATSGGDFEVTFTAREFERIEQARKLLGIATRKLFYEEAIIGYTDQTLATEAGEKTPADGKITPFITGPQVKPSKVAEKHRGKNGTED